MYTIERLSMSRWVKVDEATTPDEAYAKVKQYATTPTARVWCETTGEYKERYSGVRAVHTSTNEQVIRLHSYHFGI